jgi:hypothetical protein
VGLGVLVAGAWALALRALSLFALRRAVARDDLFAVMVGDAFGRPGSDLLSRALRRSTIGAEGFHGRVRDGIGCVAPRCGHQAIETHRVLLALGC